MKIEPLNITSTEEARKLIASIGAHPASVEHMAKKGIYLHFRLRKCPFYIANILKQEALSIGAELAVHSEVVTAKVKYTDCILMGDINRLLTLSSKLKSQSFRELHKLGEKLKVFLDNLIADKLTFKYNDRVVELKNDYLIMGILNVTPDSFSDGGRYTEPDRALTHVEKMIQEGADIIDIGGESTRPGSLAVDEDEELRRIIPVIEAVKKRFDVVVSVDTYKATVAKEALEIGVEIINDISGFGFDEKMVDTLAGYSCGIIAMHIKGKPHNMQKNTNYECLLCEINETFESILEKAHDAGIESERIVLDPGIGFGKSFAANLSILKHLKAFKVWGRPILIGTSRKSFIGHFLNIEDPLKRLNGTIASNVIAYLNGASIFRVHDVAQNREALELTRQLLSV